MKKILGCSSIRSDYDLMSALYFLLNDSEDVDFKILVSGTHLSSNYGDSIKQIEKDGFDILIKIETLLNSDSSVSRVKSSGILLQNSIEVINEYNPDIIIFAGDREDVLVYAMIGGYLNIPTLHFFAGDHVKDGYIDNPIRHATSKLATAHCVTLYEHKQRLVRMGEEEHRICVTGNLSLDKFINFIPMSKEMLKEKMNVNFSLDNYALLIFHPITSELDKVDEYFENILNSLIAKGINTFVSYPNIDHGNQKLIQVMDKYKNHKNLFFYKNLERELFLSIYKHSKLIIGNSSSGICESTSLKIPAINVGMRQRGRYASSNVIFCDTDRQSIENALEKVQTEYFQNHIKTLDNPYGSGNSTQIAFDFLMKTDFSKMLAKLEDPLEVNLI